MTPILRGEAAPLGATCRPDGTNFSLYSPHALSVDLLLYDSDEAPQPARQLTLDPETHRTGAYWHVLVPEIGHGQVYAWRVRGPNQPDQGWRFDGDKVLLDPYARSVANLANYDRQAARARGDNGPRALRSVVVDPARYDWEGDRPLVRPDGREFIYEMHLAGFTRSPSSGLSRPVAGTYAGLIEKIPYLQELGVTAVELLPVQQFEWQDAPAPLQNYWGYSTLAYFAPHRQYSSDPSPLGAVNEFRDMVKALHRAGIRVYLDVVYNHTAEGGADGPVISWRGLDNPTYYLLQDDPSHYADFTGCGNTVNANHPVTRRFILDSLRYWVQEMHVDGFRFDLAGAMTRAEDGLPLDQPALFEAMEADPVLAGTRLIAEAWDAVSLFQVGCFPGRRMAQWNSLFRDTARRFFRGDEGVIEELMARIVGSPDLYSGDDMRPSHSINYVTCHDGFSLADLVSYEQKHNLVNGEENRDGSDNNLSANHGVEGPSDDPQVVSLRNRQIRNFLSLLFLSHGTPMLVMGDEVRHTRKGNNNPWNQNNELNWLDWDQVAANKDLLRFTRQLAAFAGSLPILQEDVFWSATSPEHRGDITWHGVKVNHPDWTPSSHELAFTLTHRSGRGAVHVMMNAGREDREFQLPPIPVGSHWVKVLDTGAQAPDDVAPAGQGAALTGDKIPVLNRSLVVARVEDPKS